MIDRWLRAVGLFRKVYVMHRLISLGMEWNDNLFLAAIMQVLA
jgi:hypothetical protein